MGGRTLAWANEIHYIFIFIRHFWYIGVFIVRCKTFKCSLDQKILLCKCQQKGSKTLQHRQNALQKVWLVQSNFKVNIISMIMHC